MGVWWKNLDPFVRWFIIILIALTAVVVGAVVWTSAVIPQEYLR